MKRMYHPACPISTIHFFESPAIQRNGQPKLIIPFTTSDLPGRYLITTEDIGVNGTVVRATQVVEIKE